MSYRRKSIPWFKWRIAWGTVYLMQSVYEPDLFKVGYTQRRTKDRRAELKSKAGGQLKIVYTLSMPHAYFTEQAVLRGLRTRFFGRGDKRGTEWFRLRRTETIHDISKRIDRAARLIRFISMFKLSWPRDAEFKVFSAGATSKKGGWIEPK